MTLFDGRIDEVGEDSCAGLVLETVPQVMATIKGEMRRHRPAETTVPQFRAMIFLQRHDGASLSDVAAFLGLTLSTVSKLVEGLVQRGFVTRAPNTADRRRIVLRLTATGDATLTAARRQAAAGMARLLAGLAADERPVVQRAMEILQRIVGRRHDSITTKGHGDATGTR